MNKRDSIIIAATIAILAFGWFLYKQPDAKQQNSLNQEMRKTTELAASIPQAANFIGSLYVAMVTYTDSGFSPSEVTIPKGGAVIFRNYSSKKMRVASNPHPAHNIYPAAGGCVGSVFDSCDNIPPKVSWSFIFDSPGTWGYHDHLNPGKGGTVIVQ